MSQEDKSLLLKDLCARLSYGVKLFKVNEPESAFELYSIDKESGEIKYYKYRGKSLEIGDIGSLFRINDIPRFKPYLRPMSSMTEEERKEYERFSHLSIGFAPILMDWIYSHHLDCCGLIPKGLAIEAPEGMYNKEQ